MDKKKIMRKLLFILFLLPVFASAQFKNNNKQIINVLNYGAKGDMRSGSDGSYTGTTTFTSASGAFTSADVGKTIRVQMAAGDLITTIASITNSTTVVLVGTTTGTRSSQTWDLGTDNTTAIQAAANAVPTTGAVLYFPLGYYLKNGYTNIPNPTLITGDIRGALGGTSYDSSSTNRPHGRIIEISANLPQSINIQSGGSVWQNLDLVLSSSATLTTGVGLNVNADNVSLYNGIFNGFWTTVSQNYSAYWTANHCVFGGYQYGLVVRNLNTADAGDWGVDDCFFGGVSGSHFASSGLLIQSSGGIKITNSKWNVWIHKCVSVEILATSSNTSDFQMINNSLENYDSTGINIIANNSGVFSNIVINGNQIAPYTAHTTGININGTGATFLKGISLVGNVIYNQFSGDTAIKLIAVQNAMVVNEVYGSWTLPYYADATSTVDFLWSGTQLKTIASSTAQAGYYEQNTSNGNAASTIHYLENDRGGFASYGGMIYGSSTFAGSLFGVTRADKMFVFADGASNLGMAVGTLVAQPLIFGTNNTEAGRFNSSQHLLLGTTTDIAALTNANSIAPGRYRGITALRTLDATDYLVNCTANSFTVTLPTAVGITGRQYIIKNTGSSTTITIATTSSQTIDGAAPGTVTTTVPLRVMSDGANWITF